MLKSMTGYGRGQIQTEERDILVEIKSVNARYLEQTVRINRNYSYLEEPLKALTKKKIARGKVEISVSITLMDGKKADIQVNEDIVSGYLAAMQAYQEQHKQTKYQLIPDAWNAAGEVCVRWSDMMQMPDVFRVEKAQYDEQALQQEVFSATEQALEAFIAMRQTEGEKLMQDIQQHLQVIAGEIAVIEEKAPELTDAYRQRLYTRLSELLHTTTVDEQRILTECAIFSEKTAVDEETVRLNSHITQVEALLQSDESIGRKLDFIVQEMNREANTIGSKIQDVCLTARVVNIKSEIEKIREQIQNIE